MTVLSPPEQLIPGDHPVRGLNCILDLGFIPDAVRDRSRANNGHPAITALEETPEAVCADRAHTNGAKSAAFGW